MSGREVMVMLFKRISKEGACPVCKNAEVYRVKRAGITVKLACRILDLRPHWCPECDTFFLGPRQTMLPRTQTATAVTSGENKNGGGPYVGGLPH